MSWITNFYRSALGKKAIMAVTGIILFGWIFAHMIGNLKIYLGAGHLNEYATWLRVMGSPLIPKNGLLWISRIALLVCTWLHIQAATQLTLMNWDARPVDYTDRDYVIASYAARTMKWGGVILALFVVYHLLHLTFGMRVSPATFIEGDVYHNVVAGFQVWWVSAVYIVANLSLGLHLYHGLWSMFQSLGWNASKFNQWRNNFAIAFAVVITVGNVSIPVSVLLGILK